MLEYIVGYCIVISWIIYVRISIHHLGAAVAFPSALGGFKTGKSK